MFRLLNLAFAIARTLAMSILLVSALAAHAQQKTSAEDARRLLDECATHSQHGERQEALAACGKALPKFSAVGDRRGEAVTLNNIGASLFLIGGASEGAGVLPAGAANPARGG